MNKTKKINFQKKILNLFLILTLILSSTFVVGCSDQQSKTENNKTTTIQQTEDKNKQQNSNYEEVKVTRHIDGDTVEVTHKDGKVDKVRFIGVNTPESTTEHEKYGEEASKFTKDKLLNKTIYLEKDAGDTDKYGRLLRYIWIEQPKEINESEIKTKMFNYILASEGYAQQMTIQPNVKYADYFKKGVEVARTGNKGLWAINPNGTTKGDGITAPTTQNNTSNSSTNTQTTQQQTETTPQPSTSDNQEQTVYIGASGTKYHRENCRTLKKTRTPITLEEAKAQGREACKVCNP